MTNKFSEQDFPCKLKLIVKWPGYSSRKSSYKTYIVQCNSIEHCENLVNSYNVKNGKVIEVDVFKGSDDKLTVLTKAILLLWEILMLMEQPARL